MEILYSPKVLKKLIKKHKITTDEVEQCFYNRRGNLLEDAREEHKTTPVTQWFVAETDNRRKLKVIFVLDGDIHIKSAYDAKKEIIRIYKAKAF